MTRTISLLLAAAFSFATISVGACPLEEARKAEAEKKAGTTQTTSPSNPTL